ncbi:MAG: DUF2630 family protein [Nitrospirales bacterium]
MSGQDEDQSVLNHIQKLVTEEHGLYALWAEGTSPGTDREQLAKIQVELDQCWDLLRQRRGLHDAGQDPSKAQVRPPDVVENYALAS